MNLPLNQRLKRQVREAQLAPPIARNRSDSATVSNTALFGVWLGYRVVVDMATINLVVIHR